MDAFNADAAEFDCSMGFFIANVPHTGCETPEAALQELSLLTGSRHALREPNNGDVAPMRPVKRKRRVLSDDEADDETDQPTPTIKRGHISVGSESDPSAKQPAAKQPEQPQRTVRDSSGAASEGTLPASLCLSQRLHQLKQRQVLGKGNNEGTLQIQSTSDLTIGQPVSVISRPKIPKKTDTKVTSLEARDGLSRGEEQKPGTSSTPNSAQKPMPTSCTTPPLPRSEHRKQGPTVGSSSQQSEPANVAEGLTRAHSHADRTSVEQRRNLQPSRSNAADQEYHSASGGGRNITETARITGHRDRQCRRDVESNWTKDLRDLGHARDRERGRQRDRERHGVRGTESDREHDRQFDKRDDRERDRERDGSRRRGAGRRRSRSRSRSRDRDRHPSWSTSKSHHRSEQRPSGNSITSSGRTLEPNDSRGPPALARGAGVSPISDANIAIGHDARNRKEKRAVEGVTSTERSVKTAHPPDEPGTKRWADKQYSPDMRLELELQVGERCVAVEIHNGKQSVQSEARTMPCKFIFAPGYRFAYAIAKILCGNKMQSVPNLLDLSHDPNSRWFSTQFDPQFNPANTGRAVAIASFIDRAGEKKELVLLPASVHFPPQTDPWRLRLKCLAFVFNERAFEILLARTLTWFTSGEAPDVNGMPLVLDIDHTLVDATASPPAPVALRPHLAEFLSCCVKEGFRIYLYTQATSDHARRCVDAMNKVMQSSDWISGLIIAKQMGSIVEAKRLDNKDYDNRSVVDAAGARPMELIIDDNYSLARDIRVPCWDRTSAGHWRAADQNNLITIAAFSASDGRDDDDELMARLADIKNGKRKFKESFEGWMASFHALFEEQKRLVDAKSEDWVAKTLSVFCQDWPQPPSMAVIVPMLVKERMQRLQSQQLPSGTRR